MSRKNTKTRRPVHRRRIPLCDRCETHAAEHLMSIAPHPSGAPGYELLSCRHCWPALKSAAETVALDFQIKECGCGAC
jgi:hypothetical protein